MSRRPLRFALTAAAGLAAAGAFAPSHAQEGEPGFGIRQAANKLAAPSRMPVPRSVDLVDPAFARYVDLRALGTGLLDGDAAALTDAALALAEGERVLLRPHKSLSVAEVASAAARAAAAANDAESLKRLSALAEKRGDKELVASIKGAEKLASASRMPAPEFTIHVDEVTPEQFAKLRALVGDAKLARTLGSSRSLDPWTAEELGNLPGPMRDQAAKLLAETRAALPEDGGATDTGLSALEKLAAAARDPEDSPSDQPVVVTGGF